MDADDRLKAFFARMQSIERRVLLLDYDGTLAPFRTRRDQARPYPGVVEVLESLQSGGRCRLMLVSGRPVQEVVDLLGIDPVPPIWGAHGWERREADGRLVRLVLPVHQRRAMEAALDGVVGKIAPAERCEVKTGSVAVHWRGLPDGAAIDLEMLLRHRWGALAEEAGLELLPFDGGLELRSPGRHKGQAVRDALAEFAPRDEAGAAYLGDDQTDEDAFAELAVWAQGAEAGRRLALSVLVREPPRPTAADLVLRPPEELLTFLRRFEEVCRS